MSVAIVSSHVIAAGTTCCKVGKPQIKATDQSAHFVVAVEVGVVVVIGCIARHSSSPAIVEDSAQSSNSTLTAVELVR